jgi:hypothetical protein
VERAFEIFYEMQSEGRVIPNEVTFNALIRYVPCMFPAVKPTLLPP